VKKWKLKAPFSEECPICQQPDSQTHWLRDCTGFHQVALRHTLQDKLQSLYRSLGPDRPEARRFAQLMASHIKTAGNPLLWLGNWNTQSLYLLKSFELPSYEQGRVGPIIRAVTDIFIRMARDLWLLRAQNSPRLKGSRYRTRTLPQAQPPRTRPLMRMTPLGAQHRLGRIQTGAHPHLQKIQESAISYDSNSSYCHFAALERNDTSCLPKSIIRTLQRPAQPLSPCNCSTPCSRYPIDASSPCRNALNRTECTAGNCMNRLCTNRLTAVPTYCLPVLRVVSSSMGIFGYALFNPSPLAKHTFLGNIYGEVLTRALLAERKHTVKRSFVLEYRSRNLCLDLTWTSNQFCHLSHSCNPNARLELWHLNNQPIWKVFTNCDIPSNHLISIDYRVYHLPCTSPCSCNAPTCAITLPDESLSICSVINRTHLLMKQTQLHFTAIEQQPQSHVVKPTKSKILNSSTREATSTQMTLTRYVQRARGNIAGTSAVNESSSAPPNKRTIAWQTESERSEGRETSVHTSSPSYLTGCSNKNTRASNTDALVVADRPRGSRKSS
jgi:hypothetical protein